MSACAEGRKNRVLIFRSCPIAPSAVPIRYRQCRDCGASLRTAASPTILNLSTTWPRYQQPFIAAGKIRQVTSFSSGYRISSAAIRCSRLQCKTKDPANERVMPLHARDANTANNDATTTSPPVQPALRRERLAIMKIVCIATNTSRC